MSGRAARTVTVAVIDDDPQLRRLLQLELEDLGAKVLCWPSAEAALAELQPATIDLLLLDVGLPGMDGLSCLRELRRRGLAGEVMVMSGQWDAAAAPEVMAAGADSYVVKTDLIERLTDLMTTPD